LIRTLIDNKGRVELCQTHQKRLLQFDTKRSFMSIVVVLQGIAKEIKDSDNSQRTTKFVGFTSNQGLVTISFHIC